MHPQLLGNLYNRVGQRHKIFVSPPPSANRPPAWRWASPGLMTRGLCRCAPVRRHVQTQRKHQQAALLPQNLKSAFPDVKRIIGSHVARWLEVCGRSDDAVIRIDHEVRARPVTSWLWRWQRPAVEIPAAGTASLKLLQPATLLHRCGAAARAQMRHMFVELTMGPIVSFEIGDVVAVDELTDMVMTVQAGLFAAPIYVPGTSW